MHFSAIINSIFQNVRKQERLFSFKMKIALASDRFPGSDFQFLNEGMIRKFVNKRINLTSHTKSKCRLKECTGSKNSGKDECQVI